MRTLFPILLTVLFSACAKRPHDIAPDPVPRASFERMDCAGLTGKLQATQAELDKYTRLQDSKADNDAMGVLLLGLPLSKLTGDHERDIARLKGELIAMKDAQASQKCAPA